MGRVHRFLGLDVGVILAGLTPEQRRLAYAADITYGTNNEFGFDYLRDNMALRVEDMVQRGHVYAIVDEVDSILIDEARTPLIISGPADQPTRWYTEFAEIAALLQRERDYEVDEKKRTIGILESGIERVEDRLGIDNLYKRQHPLIQFLNNSIKAKELFHRDKEYVVKDGEVLIVDEHTGRILAGRRYNEGMHQAIEAKEGVEIKQENQTLATITLQNYFRLYDKLAGMTGTAMTEESEFNKIYDLGVVPIPTNMEMIRADQPDLVYRTEEAKFGAVVEDLVQRHTKGQPVLVGTTSVAKSEHLSHLLSKRGIPHEVLNAKHHERRRPSSPRQAGAARSRSRPTWPGEEPTSCSAATQSRWPWPSSSSAGSSRWKPGGVRGRVGADVGEAATPGRDRTLRGHRTRWAVCARHGAARITAHRQPAPRSVRSAGRPW